MDKYLKNTRIIAVIILFFSILNSGSYAFTADDYSRNHFYGSYIGFDFDMMSQINQFEGTAFLGYRVLPRLHAGFGGKYQYYYNTRMGNVFGAHIFGPMVFTDMIAITDMDEFLPFRFIDGAFFIHAEMNLFNLPERHFSRNNNGENRDSKRFFRPTWLTGAGIQRQAGVNSYLYILFMFDISTHSNKIYSNPLFRIGMLF